MFYNRGFNKLFEYKGNKFPRFRVFNIKDENLQNWRKEAEQKINQRVETRIYKTTEFDNVVKVHYAIVGSALGVVLNSLLFPMNSRCSIGIYYILSILVIIFSAELIMGKSEIKPKIIKRIRRKHKSFGSLYRFWDR